MFRSSTTSLSIIPIPSPNFDCRCEREREIDTLLLFDTGSNNVRALPRSTAQNSTWIEKSADTRGNWPHSLGFDHQRSLPISSTPTAPRIHVHGLDNPRIHLHRLDNPKTERVETSNKESAPVEDRAPGRPGGPA